VFSVTAKVAFVPPPLFAKVKLIAVFAPVSVSPEAATARPAVKLATLTCSVIPP
jgi:hypothetical protein